MKRFLFASFLFCLLSVPAMAQPDPNDPNSRPLNASELREARWYDNLEDALANPLAVYKLSLSEQKLKAMPAEILKFKNLQVLNLNSCKLKELPDSIGQLHKLEMLSLYDNKLRVLPNSFRELRHLEVLYLGGNKLTEIPIWIGGMGRLRRLDISRNPITPLELIYIKSLMPKVELTY